ncbi:SCO2521 family protein [Dactylosporangium maewongense]|uniref:SCO2521 family protein n=1 Tax=Dactylosporangium maewongense TaxID=634393 RepID=A0ABN2AIM5_9ACTN
MLTFGEVHTGLLQNSTPLARDSTVRLLDTAPGSRVIQSERPIAYAVSPDRLIGVDCALPSSSGARVRAVGTVVSHAAVTGGHVLQGSAHTSVTPSAENRRMQWPHYLARPARLETIGKVKAGDVRDGYLRHERSADRLDMAGIAGHTMDAVQGSAQLDHRSPFRARRTHLRWVFEPTAGHEGLKVEFTVQSETLRTLTLAGSGDCSPSVVELCEDLALHDWLLTTLLSIAESALTRSTASTQRVRRLQPAVEYLVPLWMPAARLDGEVLPVWESLDRRPGFTRQWDLSVGRVRDQITLAMIELLRMTSAVTGTHT